MSRYGSRRRSESMRAWRPKETPATDVCIVYRQQWRRNDGGSARTFDVLAMNVMQALRFGAFRLSDKYGEHVDDWMLVDQNVLERHTAFVIQILTIETAAERDEREAAYMESRAAS